MKRTCRRACGPALAVLLLLPLGTAVHGDTYDFDRLHTQILFFVDHFGFSKSEGEFLEFEGHFTFDPDRFEDTEVELTIYTESVDMDDDRWNRKMKGRSYFDTRTFPTITFRSTRIEQLDERNALVHGDLTLLGTTLPISVEMRLNKVGLNIATGRRTAGFSGGTVIRRSEFGMTSHTKYIGDEIEIRLEVEGAVTPRRKNDS